MTFNHLVSAICFALAVGDVAATNTVLRDEQEDMIWGGSRELSPSGYDIGCIYPPTMLKPFSARSSVAVFLTDFARDNKMETPMVIRLGHNANICSAMCLTYHDPKVKDPLTNKAHPSVNGYGQNAWSITMCGVQCVAHVFEEISQDALMQYMEHARTEIKLDLELPSDHKELKDATINYYETGSWRSLVNKLEEDNYHPLTMGLVAGFRVMNFLKTDGWNADGMSQYSHRDDAVGPCTGNCRKFQDTSGYAPVPNPRTYPLLSDDMSKYNCTGLCRSWQPLQEGDDVGSLKNQEFVVPHIGEHAHTYLRAPSLTLTDPEYDLYADSLLVIEEVRITSGDDYRKAAVKVFDDKLKVRSIIQGNFRKQIDVSLQDYIIYLYGMSMAEYDGVVQAWHEKVAHDLVRPTTVIKHWDNDMLMTFGGDVDHDGPVDIAARDFEAFIRVMPHPEFPSGSSCLCTAYMEYTDLYTDSNFDTTLKYIDHKEMDTQFNFTDMTDLRDHCSISRIWGGIHYAAAVPAGEDICTGLGELGFEYVTKMKNGSTFGKSGPLYKDDERPICMTQ